jgi:hypothetical protein
MLTATDIAKAWHDIGCSHFTRRNKSNPSSARWEVVRDNGERMEVVARYADEEEAARHCHHLDSEERGASVLRLINDPTNR